MISRISNDPIPRRGVVVFARVVVETSAQKSSPSNLNQKMDLVKSIYISGWSDEQICEFVKQEKGVGLVRNSYPFKF